MRAKPKKLIPAIIIGLAVIIGVTTWILNRRPFLYAGAVEATEVDISARVQSVISAREVDEGAQVQAGQTLIRLACEDLRLAADIAENQHAAA